MSDLILAEAMVERAARALCVLEGNSWHADESYRVGCLVVARALLIAAVDGCEVAVQHRVTYGPPRDLPETLARSTTAWVDDDAARVRSMATGYRQPVVERRLRIVTGAEVVEP